MDGRIRYGKKKKKQTENPKHAASHLLQILFEGDIFIITAIMRDNSITYLHHPKYSNYMTWVNRESILHHSKSKRNIMKLLSVDYSIFIFRSYGTLVVHIGSGMAAQQSFCQACQMSSSKFCYRTQRSADALIFALFCKAPANAIMQRKQWQLGQKQFWHVLQTWLLCSHPWPNMNEHMNVPTERRIIMLSCTEISFAISFFLLRNLESNSGFLFFNTHTVYIVLNTQVLWNLIGKHTQRGSTHAHTHIQCIIFKNDAVLYRMEKEQKKKKKNSAYQKRLSSRSPRRCCCWWSLWGCAPDRPYTPQSPATTDSD